MAWSVLVWQARHPRPGKRRVSGQGVWDETRTRSVHSFVKGLYMMTTLPLKSVKVLCDFYFCREDTV